MKIKALRGMSDILPDEAARWCYLEEKARGVFELYGYREIRTPILEETPLFVRSIGKTTDIVSKEMYSFSDAKGRSLTLRPEETAPVVRAYLEHNLDKKVGFSKLYYIGPMFRSERPQAGRTRQFHQVGVEAIGSLNPYLDCEVIMLLVRFLAEIGLSGYQIKLNSVGCGRCRPKYKTALRKALAKELRLLCQDCQRRFETNVLRVLDCKKEICRRIAGRSPAIADWLCPDCGSHFAKVNKILASLKIAYQPDPHLVRGLDYYTKTAFEVIHPILGAQDAIGAGGRYDELTQQLGGPQIGAVGMSIGVERVMMVATSQGIEFPGLKSPNIYLATIGEVAYQQGYELLERLRRAGLKSEIDYEGRSLKAQMRAANKVNSKYVIILGEDEAKRGIAKIKDMASGQQSEIEIDKVVEEISRKVRP